jgi:hypothetical protein
MGQGRLNIFASAGSSLGTQPDGVLGYALDVVVSGSTLIVPDLAAMPSGAGPPDQDARLFAAVPVRSADGLAIGALALADRRLLPFDVQDLAILEHIATRLGVVFSGTEGPGVLQGAGVLVAESWRHCLGCEIKHLGSGKSLVIALASIQGEAMIPGSRPEHMESLEQTIGKLVERLPPRTALGRLTPETLAAYSLVEEPGVGEQALLSLIEALDGEAGRACAGMLSVTGLRPTDGGAALLDIADWLLGSAMTRGPATTLVARLAPSDVEHRAA